MSETSRRPIDAQRLRGALRASPFGSWKQLADAAGLSHVAVGKIVNGLTQVPRRGNGEALARALNVPYEWLTAESNRLPFVPFPGALSFKGNGSVVRSTAPDIPDPPPEFLLYEQVLLNTFLEQCHEALRRDLGRRFGNRADDAFEEWGSRVLSLLAGIVEPSRWSTKCLKPRFVVVDDEPTFAASIKLWERILQPWFDGRGTISIAAIADIARVLKLDTPEKLDAFEKNASGLERRS